MQEMVMAMREDDGAPRPEYIELNEDIAHSKDLLYVLKKECLERKALTRVERLPSTIDAALRSLNSSGKSWSTPEGVEKLRIKKKDGGGYSVSSAGSKLTLPRKREDRVYFLSEKYEDVSGDESQTPLKTESHDVIERFLPLVDAMEQVVPTDGDDLPDDGGLVIDDSASPARDVSVKPESKPVVQSSQTEMPLKSGTSSFKAGLSASDTVEAQTSRTQGEVAKGQLQSTEPKAKKAKTPSRARKPPETPRAKSLNRSSPPRPSRPRQKHSGSQKASSNAQHNKNRGGSGSEVLSDDDSSSTTTIDGTEYQMSSDEDNKVPRTAEPEGTAHRHGSKRGGTRSSEELGNFVGRDPLNEGYNRLVQELPGFNWLEQKIMGHNTVPVKPALIKPPATTSREVTCPEKAPIADTGEARISTGADILSRSMSEIQDDVVYSQSSETVIKCVSTQTELLPECPMEDSVVPPVVLKTEDQNGRLPDSRQLPQTSAVSSTTIQDDSHKSEPQSSNLSSPGSKSPDVMYLGVVEKQLKSPGCSSTVISRPLAPTTTTEAVDVPQTREPVQVAGTQQKIVCEPQRQVYPWFIAPDGSTPSSPAQKQPPLQGLTDVCHQNPTVHGIITMPEKAVSQQYVTVVPQKPFEQPIVPQVNPRVDGVPLYPFLGFPTQCYVPYATTAQNRQAFPPTAVQQPPNNVQQGVAHVQTAKDDSHTQKKIPILPKPSCSRPRQQPRQRAQPRNKPEGARCAPVRRKTDQGPPRKEHADKPPTEPQKATPPAKTSEYCDPPPLSVPQDVVRVSPVVRKLESPVRREEISTEQELLKRKDELKYLDHLASQKEAEYDRLLQMRTEKLRILTELENKIKSASETDKSHGDNGTAPSASRPPCPRQEVRNVYQEADGHPVPLQKYLGESQKRPPAVASQRTHPGPVPHYPAHSQPNATIPVVPPANIPMTVPLIGRGLFNVRSIDIPREIPPVMVHGNAALHPAAQGRGGTDFHQAQRQYPAGHQAAYRSGQAIKRAHSTDDVDGGKQEGHPPVQNHTVQRPFPQRAGKPPPPLPCPEARSAHWPTKENYRPDFTDYYSHPNFPFQHYYHGRANQGPLRSSFGYFPAQGDYGHHPTVPPRDMDSSRQTSPTRRPVGVDASLPVRCSGEERVLYFHGSPFQRDAAPAAPHPAVHHHRPGLHQSGSQTQQATRSPHKPQQQATKDESSKCACCGKYAQYLCSGCQSTWYCGQQCQRSNWTQHSVLCRSMKP